MMFRLKKIEILLNPLYSEPKMVSSRMRTFSCLMWCWMGLYSSLIIFAISEVAFRVRNIDDDRDKDNLRLILIEFGINASLCIMMLIITPYFAIMGLNYLSVLRSSESPTGCQNRFNIIFISVFFLIGSAGRRMVDSCYYFTLPPPKE